MKNTVALTLLALIAFAANSVLCRWALADSSIDAYSFTAIRIISGASTLMLLVLLLKPVEFSAAELRRFVSVKSTLALLVYMFGFSYAYIDLGAGLGALVLFAAVQFTMIASHVIKGHKLNTLEWAGCLISISGLVYLLAPGSSQSTMNTLSIALMLLAGIAWGFYTLFGKGGEQPLVSTAVNFSLAVPFALIVGGGLSGNLHVTQDGLTYSILSGSLSSGAGYALWYSALRHISTVTASVSQLSVPVIATAGGVILLAEPLTLHFIVSSSIILCGIGCVLLAPKLNSNNRNNDTK